MQDLNWDDLRIFLALARKAKLSHAARATGVDATTISRRIARLEAALGVRLFELSPQGHVLTSHGRALLPAAETAERGALNGLNSITGSNAGLRSEEHTSELQAQMRNSYAVSCLQKKKSKTN